MEQPPVLETVLGKRKSGHSDESNSAQWDSSSSSFSLCCNVAPGYGSPSVNDSKRNKQQAFCSNDDQSVQQHFWVWDHHVQPQQRSQGLQLQPADSSTAQTFAAAKDILQQADQMDCCASDTKAGLARTSSAPELLKLAQDDSAAWQAQHQCQQPTAYLSHRVSAQSCRSHLQAANSTLLAS